MSEMEDLIKSTMKSVGHYTILAYELENEKLQLASLDGITKTPIILNKIRSQEQTINAMAEKVGEQECTVVKGVTQIADKYKAAASLGLGEVREGIEDAMIKFGSTISKDTLDQINKESATIKGQLSTFKEEQQKNITTITDDFKTKMRYFDDKYDQLKETADKHSKVVDRLSAANTTSIQTTATFSSKLQALNKCPGQLEEKFDNDLKGLNKRIDEYKTTMDEVSQGLATAVKDDMEYLSSKLTDARKMILDDRKTLETYKTDLTAMRMELIPLLRTTTIEPSSSSPPSLPSSSPSATLANISKEVPVDDSSSLTTSDKAKWEELPQRLDNLEKYMLYILSKVDAMEPSQKQAVTELKNAVINPISIHSSDEHATTTSSGTKQLLEVTSDSELMLLSEIKRVEYKLTNLVDFLHQFRSSILDPSFPGKLDTGLQEFEACLRKHEMFIGYLVDPQATMQQLTVNSSSTDLVSKDYDHLQQQSILKITPSLLTTISQFIADETHKSLQHELDEAASPPSKKQKTQHDKQMVEHMEMHMKKMVAEHVDPLKKKIQELETKLQQKERRK